jgi:hypothetical protein
MYAGIYKYSIVFKEVRPPPAIKPFVEAIIPRFDLDVSSS